MKGTVTLLLTGVLTLSSCEMITGSRGSFFVRAKDDHLVLTNQLSEPVHYVAMEQAISAAVLIAPPSEWPALAPGGEKEIPYEDLFGYTPSAERAIVGWWTESEGNGDGFVIDL